MTSTTFRRPAALISTPAENSWCEACQVQGVRYASEFGPASFAHCPSCGSTDLVDDRSPFEVAAEALENWTATAKGDDPHLAMARYDAAEAAVRSAVAAEADHCGDCATQYARLRILAIRLGWPLAG